MPIDVFSDSDVSNVTEDIPGEDVTEPMTSGSDEDVAGEDIQEGGATPPPSEPVEGVPDQEETEPTREVIYVDIDGAADGSNTGEILVEVRDRLDVLIQHEHAIMEFNSMTSTFLLVVVFALICTAVYKLFRIFF